MRVQMLRQRFGDTGDADIPGDVPLELAGRQAEIAEGLREQPAVVVAGQQERRAACGIMFQNRRNICVSKE